MTADLWIKIVSIMLAVPAAICFASNIVFHSDGLLVVLRHRRAGRRVDVLRVAVPLQALLPAAVDCRQHGVTLGYLYLLEYLSGTQGWFFPLALPIVLGVAVLSLAIIVLIQRKVLRELYTAAAVFLAIGLLTVLVELSIDLYLTGSADHGVVVVLAHFVHGDGGGAGAH